MYLTISILNLAFESNDYFVKSDQNDDKKAKMSFYWSTAICLKMNSFDICSKRPHAYTLQREFYRLLDHWNNWSRVASVVIEIQTFLYYCILLVIMATMGQLAIEVAESVRPLINMNDKKSCFFMEKLSFKW